MLIADPSALVKQLHPLPKRALERAAGVVVTSRHYEVTVEHFALALLDDADSDLAVMAPRVGVDVDRMRRGLQRDVESQRSGNTGQPVLSPTLIEWMQDALVVSATEIGDSRIRSGALFARLLAAPTRYLGGALAGTEDVSFDALRKRFADVVAGSAEAARQAGAPNVAESAAPDGALASFTSNLTERARAGALDPVLGREAEVRQVIDILCRRRKNNPMIVGEPGVGKTALVEGLALRIAAGEVPAQLRDVEVRVLDLGALQAGAGVRGEFERRLKSVIDEVKASPKPIVLFIDEAHTLIGAGGPQGGGDAANLLKPALARGELRTIAATTWGEFKRYFDKDAALERRFQPVKVDEPSIENATAMLRGIAERFEQAHGVVIRDEAVRAAVTLSSRYITARQLPDKAVDLLDTAAARAKVLRGAPPPALEDVRVRLTTLERELAALDRELAAGHPVDEEARARLRQERDATRERGEAIEAEVLKQRDLVERIDGLRAEGAVDRLPDAIAALRAIPREQLHVRADVDEDLIASVIADWTGIPVGRMVKDDVQAVLALEPRLNTRVKGQDDALAVIGRELRAARSGLKPPGPPLGVFLLPGPSGVGKTETALALADLLFGGEPIKIDMSEFGERHMVSRLIGSPPGYAGFGEGGKLTEAVRQRPYSVVLLDEVEKAHRDVMNIFYQVFDKGDLTDGEGRTINFSNTVVVLTANLASNEITRHARPDAPPIAYDELVSIVKPILSDYFKPALLARMTVVPYVPIRPEALGAIVRVKLGVLSRTALDAHRLELTFDDAVVEAIAARCREVESGARNIDHILRGTVLPLVSNTLLSAMADGRAARAMRVALGAGGDFTCDLEAR